MQEEKFITSQEILQNELIRRIQNFRENKSYFKIGLIPNIKLPQNFYIYGDVALLAFDFGAEQTYTADSIEISDVKFSCIVANYNSEKEDWEELQISIPLGRIMFITDSITCTDKRGFKTLHLGDETITLN